MLSNIYSFLVSMKTAFWIFAVVLVFIMIGSFLQPMELAFFSGIDDEPLFRWLAGNNDLTKVWWVWGIVAALTAMGLSTVLCTIDYLLKRLSRYRFLLKISPQIMHIGALLIMLGHLLTGSYGFKKDVTLMESQSARPGRDVTFSLEKMDLSLDEYGLATNWSGTIRLKKGDGPPALKEIRPAWPVYFGGLGFYFQSVTMEENPAAVLRVSHDPGAPWAFLGGVLMILGGLGYLTGRFNITVMESHEQTSAPGVPASVTERAGR